MKIYKSKKDNRVKGIKNEKNIYNLGNFNSRK